MSVSHRTIVDMSANGRSAIIPSRGHSRTIEAQQPYSKRHTAPSASSFTTNTTAFTAADDVHLSIADTATDSHSTQSDGFDQLCAAIDARLQLTSQCMLLLTRILQQLSRHSNPSTSSLLPSLRHSLTDADATHAELLALYERLASVKIDRRLEGAARKEKKRRREQIEQEVVDVSARFAQIKTLATAKLDNNGASSRSGGSSKAAKYGAAASPHQASPAASSHDTQPLLSSHHASSSSSSPPQSDDASASSGLPATYQTADLVLASPSSQELYDAEADAVQRSVFIEQVERDVVTLHDMFVDMHGMVSEQAHSITSLESSIGRSAAKVRDGLGEVLKAEEYARRRRGRMFCCWVWVGVLLSIVVLVLYALGGSG